MHSYLTEKEFSFTMGLYTRERLGKIWTRGKDVFKVTWHTEREKGRERERETRGYKGEGRGLTWKPRCTGYRMLAVWCSLSISDWSAQPGSRRREGGGSCFPSVYLHAPRHLSISYSILTRYWIFFFPVRGESSLAVWLLLHAQQRGLTRSRTKSFFALDTCASKRLPNEVVVSRYTTDVQSLLTWETTNEITCIKIINENFILTRVLAEW